MFYIFLILVCLLFFMVIEVTNMLVWWSVFIIMDVVFIFLCKNSSNFSSVMNYFILQECLGLVFLFFTKSLLQFVVVMMKLGLLPFHFWLFSVVSGLKNWVFMWFLTLQKLPLVGIMLMLINNLVTMLLVMSFLVGYLQLFLLKNFKMMLLLSSSESFNWMFLGYMYFFFNGFMFFLYYLFLSILLIPYLNSEFKNVFNWLVIFIYINMPLGMTFFIKIFIISSLMNFVSLFLIFIFMLMFLNFLSFFYWMIVKVMSKNIEFNMNLNYNFIIYVLMMIILVYCFSKNSLYYFDSVKLMAVMMDNKWCTMFVYGAKWYLS